MQNNQNAPSTSRLFWALAVASVIFLLDVGTKIWAYTQLRGAAPINIIPGFFRLDYAENTGIAFSLFQDHSEWLAVIIPLAFIVLVVLIYKMFIAGASDGWYLMFFGLIMGGALGNILDRLYNGFVIDFFDVYIGRYHWPTFNVADSALTVGAAILAGKLLFGETVEEPKEQNSPTPETAETSTSDSQSKPETFSS